MKSQGKITALSKQQHLDLSIINGKDHAESFLLLTTDRVAAFSEDDILLAGLAATSQTPNGFRLISIDGMLADPYALMTRRDDPQFMAAVDAALREVFASGEVKRIYDKWFVGPIPPHNVVLNFPMSDQLARALAKPTDSGDPEDYKQIARTGHLSGGLCARAQYDSARHAPEFVTAGDGAARVAGAVVHPAAIV